MCRRKRSSAVRYWRTKATSGEFPLAASETVPISSNKEEAQYRITKHALIELAYQLPQLLATNLAVQTGPFIRRCNAPHKPYAKMS